MIIVAAPTLLEGPPSLGLRALSSDPSPGPRASIYSVMSPAWPQSGPTAWFLKEETESQKVHGWVAGVWCACRRSLDRALALTIPSVHQSVHLLIPPSMHSAVLCTCLLCGTCCCAPQDISVSRDTQRDKATAQRVRVREGSARHMPSGCWKENCLTFSLGIPTEVFLHAEDSMLKSK